jgi:hypothetical protein
MEDNGWIEYRKLVISELQRSNDRLTRIESDITDIKQGLVVLQTKIYFASSTLAFLISAAVGILTSVIKI